MEIRNRKYLKEAVPFDLNEKWVRVDDIIIMLEKGANADWEAEVLEKEVLKHNVSCNNICNIASDLKCKLNLLFTKLGRTRN